MTGRCAPSALRVGLCLLVGVLGIPVPVQAQWDLGLEAGATHATWSGSFVEAGGTWGARFAIVVEHHVSGRWTVAAASVWQQKGASNVRAPGSLDGADFKTSHLAFPVSIAWGFPLGTRWTLIPHVGIAAAVTMDCQAKDTATVEFEEDCGVAIPATETADVQVDIPLGLHLVRRYQGGSRFVATVRHEIGVTQVLPNLAPPGESAHNRTWSFTFGFSLPVL